MLLLDCCAGSGQDAADGVTVGLYEALPAHSRTPSRHRSQVDACQLDGRDQTLGAKHARKLPHWRPSPAGNFTSLLAVN